MKRLLLVVLYLCAATSSNGSPAKGSPAQEEYLKMIKDEVRLRTKNNEPLVFAFEGNNGNTRMVNLTSEVESTSFLASNNYTQLVGFYLFQKKNNEVQVTKLPMDAEKFKEAGFQKSYETKVIVHGFNNDLRSDIIQLTARGFARDFPYNVLAVDWGKISNNMNYPSTRYEVEGVGQYLGQLLSLLYKASLIKPNNLHVIGHSLGAHVAGYAGKTVLKDGWKIGRITGLDPAGPLFTDPAKRLTKDDTAKLDVIHTCAKFLGITGNIGHIDFYPNGGMAIQPGCNWLDLTGVCSHGRAYEYFIESIKNPKAFLAKFCDNVEDDDVFCDEKTTAVMGNWLDYKKEGAYYLKTAKSTPFGLGDKGIK